MVKKKKVLPSKKLIKKPVKKIISKPTVRAKKKKVLATPKGYNSITPYLIIDQASKAIAFYKKVFGAKEVLRMDRPDGKIMHAELKIGDSKIMLSDACPEMGAHAPDKTHYGAISIHLYVKDVDTVVKSAIKAGAIIIKPVEDMFYGDRSGMLQDPYGHMWCVSSHIEDVTPGKIKKRAEELFGKNK